MPVHYGYIYALLGGLIFFIGLFGVLLRRNAVAFLLCLELMLNATNLVLIAGSRIHRSLEPQVFALMVLAIAAVEVALGLAIVVMLARRGTLDLDMFRTLAGKGKR